MVVKLIRKSGTYRVTRTKPRIWTYPRRYPRVRRSPHSVKGFRLSGGNTRRWARWDKGAEEIFRVGKGGFSPTIRNRKTGEVWLYSEKAYNQRGPKIGIEEPERQHLYTKDIFRAVPKTKQKQLATKIQKIKEREKKA